MIFKNIKTYAACVVLSGFMCALVSCDRKDEPVQVPATVTPIELSASTQDGFTKGAVSGVENLAGDGFVVWAQWTKDPDDPDQFTGEYASGSTNLVFGLNGTKVYYPDWNYSPKRFWQRGSYVFAAALPASFFNASYAKTDAELAGKNITASIDVNPTDDTESLNLKFTGTGFVLGGLGNVSGTSPQPSAQPDLMYAFASVDNKLENASKVSFNFVHTCSLLGVKLTSDSAKALKVKSVKIFGIHKSAVGLFEVTRVAEDNTDRLRTLLSNPTTENDCFAEFIRPDGTGEAALKWNVTGGADATPVQLVKDLIVFPEDLTDCPLMLKVAYDDGSGTDKYLNATVPSGIWDAGKVYVYTLSVDSVEVGEPEVTDWVDGEKIEIDIE